MGGRGSLDSVFQALADPSRRAMVERLSRGSATVSDLAAPLRAGGGCRPGVGPPEPLGGPLFHFNLTGNRRAIGVDDPRLDDRVADNMDFHDMTESERLLVGTGFGIVTDIEPSPDGTLYVVSLDQGTIHEVSRSQ